MKRAFTLAEMLISFVIVAIIAGLLMFNFKKVNPNNHVMLYKKTYFTIQEAISILANDANKFPDRDRVFLSRAGDENSEVYSVEDAEYFCRQLAGMLNTVGKIQCSKSSGGAAEDYNFMLSNGVTVSGLGGQTINTVDANGDPTTTTQMAEFGISNDGSHDGAYTRAYRDICIDVDGVKGVHLGCELFEPNGIKNRDRFRIRIYFNGKVTTAPTWGAENAILKSGSKSLQLKLEDLPDIDNAQ